MINQFSRTEMLIGKNEMKKLQTMTIAVFGIGGVGSFAVEGLARSGIQNFILVDNDKISVTNLNRQIHSLHSTIGKYKVDVMKDRILDINPNAKVKVFKEFFMPNSNIKILDNSIDYIVDAIDTVTAKIELVLQAQNLKIPIISSMGTGNKLQPSMLEVTDINKTSVCPLAKVMRKELKIRGINNLKVVYSKEIPIKMVNDEEKENNKRSPGSISFVPSVAGMIIAGEVVRDILKNSL